MVMVYSGRGQWLSSRVKYCALLQGLFPLSRGRVNPQCEPLFYLNGPIAILIHPTSFVPL